MSELISKFAPTAVVAAVVTWCCWPYLSGPAAGPQLAESEVLPEIAPSLLSPTIEPPPERDPFRAGEVEGRAADADKPAQVRRPAPEPPAPVEKELPPQRDPLEIVSSLPLQATYVQGGRRLALISGQVYAEGQPLALSEPVTEPCIVARILPHTVRIRHQGRVAEIKYRDLAATSIPLSRPVQAGQP